MNMPEMAPNRGKTHRFLPFFARVRLPPAPAFAGASPGDLGAIVSTRQMRDPSLFRAAGGRIFAIWGRFGHAFAARVRVVLVDLYRMTYLCVIQMPIVSRTGCVRAGAERRDRDRCHQGGVAHEPMASQPGGRTHQQSAKLWLAHKDPRWWVRRLRQWSSTVV